MSGVLKVQLDTANKKYSGSVVPVFFYLLLRILYEKFFKTWNIDFEFFTLAS